MGNATTTEVEPSYIVRQIIYAKFGDELDRLTDAFMAAAAAAGVQGFTDEDGDFLDGPFGVVVDLVDRVFWYALADASRTSDGEHMRSVCRMLQTGAPRAVA